MVNYSINEWISPWISWVRKSEGTIEKKKKKNIPLYLWFPPHWLLPIMSNQKQAKKTSSFPMLNYLPCYVDSELHAWLFFLGGFLSWHLSSLKTRQMDTCQFSRRSLEQPAKFCLCSHFNHDKDWHWDDSPSAPRLEMYLCSTLVAAAYSVRGRRVLMNCAKWWSQEVPQVLGSTLQHEYLRDTVQPTKVCISRIFHIQFYGKNGEHAILYQDALLLISLNSWVLY